jgi:hypothetical protein
MNFIVNEALVANIEPKSYVLNITPATIHALLQFCLLKLSH